MPAPKQVEAPLQPSAPRRLPVQQRSRERQERILSVASQLMAQKGSDQIKMSEVAELAGISIGSLYQYFPDKQAIVRTLAERYSTENRRCIEEALAKVRDRDGLVSAFSDLVDQYYDIVRAGPVMRDIWSATQTDKQLMAIELADSKASGALLAAAMRRVHPKGRHRNIDTLAFLVWQLGEATMRLTLSHGPAEGRKLVDAYKRMVLSAISQP